MFLTDKSIALELKVGNASLGIISVCLTRVILSFSKFKNVGTWPLVTK